MEGDRATAAPPAFPGPHPAFSPWLGRRITGRPLCRVLAFPSEVPVDAATARCDTAIRAGRGWRRVAENPGGEFRWRREFERAEVCLVLAAVIPVVLVAVAGRPEAEPGPPRWLAGIRERAALRRVRAAAGGVGGREVDPRRLPDLLALADERQAWWVAAEKWLRDVEYLRQFRRCPECGGRPLAASRWCPVCEYEFTGVDDHARDRQVLQWQQAVAAVRRARELRTADLFLAPGRWRPPTPPLDMWWSQPPAPQPWQGHAR